MEDTVAVVSAPTHTLAAVFDGHGGDAVAQFARARVGDVFATVMSRAPAASTAADTALEVLTELERCVALELGSEGAGRCGATGTVVVVDDCGIGAAWLGDSDSVLCTMEEGLVEEALVEQNQVLTIPHKPDRADETDRIEALGGAVGRLTRTLDDGNDYPYGPARTYTDTRAGGLAISRALGNLDLRPFVSGEPECSLQARSGGDVCVVVASDGVWDVLPPKQLCGLVLSGPSHDISERIVEEALKRGTQDNVAAAVIVLDDHWFGGDD